jgi:hypothetical protein
MAKPEAVRSGGMALPEAREAVCCLCYAQAWRSQIAIDIYKFHGQKKILYIEEIVF